MGRLTDTFNLEKQFVFYASYHNTPINVAIHILCIWPILATAITMLQYTPVFAETTCCLKDLPHGELIKINGAFIACAIYIVWYLIMEPVAGGLGACLVSLLYMISAHLVATEAVFLGGYSVFQVALTIHVMAWILQFIGHGVFEGRAPALLDSLDQAILTAPLFVLLEILFFFGYRREFHAKMMKQVESNIKEFKKAKKA